MSKYNYLYKITNNINGKIYIGIHSSNKENDNYFGSGELITKAIKKYGKENFTKEILYYVPTREDLFDLERWIVTLEFVNRNDTYNLSLGGYGVVKERTKRHRKLISERMIKNNPCKREDVRKKISETKKGKPSTRKGKHLTIEARQKMSESKKGRIPWNKGKTGIYSQETRQKMSESHKGQIPAFKGHHFTNKQKAYISLRTKEGMQKWLEKRNNFRATKSRQ